MYDDEEETPTRRFRLMHFTMVMLSLLFISKVSDIVTTVRDAQAAEEAKPEEAKPEEAKAADAAAKPEEKPAEAGTNAASGADASKTEEKPTAEGEVKPTEAATEGGKKEEGEQKEGEKAPKEEMTEGAGKHSVKEIEALKAKEAAAPYTQSELDLLQNLTKRREELDEREKELDLKSKVLEATEKRINDKVTEMKALQADLTKVVAEYNKHQDAEIMSLVKIYENMKPLDAAAIFNEMDMPILLEVIDKMSERKVAPVLAGMDPKRAKDVTQELAEMRRGRAKVGAGAADATTGN